MATILSGGLSGVEDTEPIWILSQYRSALMRMPAVRVSYTETPIPELPDRWEKDRT